MRYRDEFDGPDSGVFGAITGALGFRERFEARKPFFATAIVLGLAVLLAGVVFYTYPRETQVRDRINTPIVRADDTPYKAKPDEPGGMAVPYRESTVFDALTTPGAGRDARVENILDETEDPVSREQLFAGLNVEEEAPLADVAPVTQAEAPAVATPVEPTVVEQPASEPLVTAKGNIPIPMPKPDIKTAIAANKTEPAAGVQKIVEEKTTGAGPGFYVQLGSLQTRDAATAEWIKLQGRFEALKPLSLRIEEANISGRGIYYRVQGGPLAEADARAVCAKIEAAKPGGCLVARR